MNADFSRVLSLLRQEKGISQRKAAAALGISQALLSHYENGIREPGLNFVAKACDYYHVSADYLLGRSLSRDGAMIEAEDLADASEDKEDLKGSVMAKLQKAGRQHHQRALRPSGPDQQQGRCGPRGGISQRGPVSIIPPALSAAGGNEGYFSTGSTSFNMDIVSADMTLARVEYAKALEAYRGEYPPMDSQSLAEEYSGLSQSMAQVLHNADERVKKLEE